MAEEKIEVRMTIDELQWCVNASEIGGSFVRAFAQAMLRADPENTELLHEALAAVMEKYPKYSRMSE